MEFYSAIKNQDIMNFAHKWMELENIILIQNNMHGMWILAKNVQNT